MKTTRKSKSSIIKNVECSYFRDELQHSLDTFHHPFTFTTNKHNSICRLRTALLKQLDAGLCVLEMQKGKKEKK